MMLAHYHIFWLFSLSVRLARVYCHADYNDFKSCWYTNSSQCLVHAALRQASDPQAPILPMEIDCRPTEVEGEHANNISASKRNDYILRNYEHTLSVVLNGCHTPPAQSTYIGFEYLPHCSNIRRVVLERFHSDILPILSCAQNESTVIEYLHLQHNELSSISSSSLLAYGSYLRELHILGNSLRYIERGVCNELSNLEIVEISNEEYFTLKMTDSDLFSNCSNLLQLTLHKLQSINVLIFQNLPLNLTSLTVSETLVESKGAVLFRNPQQMLNVSFINCGIETFSLSEEQASVKYLNLSGNMLKEFNVITSSVARVEILDLSKNKLTTIPLNWLKVLPYLKYISLRYNSIYHMYLDRLLHVATYVELIDLRNNHLISLSDDENEYDSSRNSASVKLRKSQLYDYERVRLQVGDNPWNCKWLLHFAHMQPHKFHIFQYDKFISKLNVNGLACSMESQTEQTQNYSSIVIVGETQPSTVEIPTAETIANYTLIYGRNWERRNQRAEALIIVFLLPLGIACLFVLLYMWIYCQKIFHCSFYRSCRWPLCQQRQQQTGGDDTNRQMPVDVIRHLSQTPNDNYEVPLNGNLTICNNCTSTPCDMCSKQFEPQAPFNITFEAMPYDAAHKLYEEITSDEVMADEGANQHIQSTNTTTTTSATSTQQIYDHLTFEQPATYI